MAQKYDLSRALADLDPAAATQCLRDWLLHLLVHKISAAEVVEDKRDTAACKKNQKWVPRACSGRGVGNWKVRYSTGDGDRFPSMEHRKAV